MRIKVGLPNQETWLEGEESEEEALSSQQRAIRVMVGRAATVYLVLFMGLALIMSALGINPLVRNGLMPKALLIFVGLALFMALASRLANLSHEYGQSWWNIARGLVHIAPSENLDEPSRVCDTPPRMKQAPSPTPPPQQGRGY